MRFAERLKELRRISGKTQETVSNETGIKRSTYGMYESGSREPDFETAESLADYFNVDMNYLFGKEDKSTYYIDPEAAQIAQDIANNPGKRALFDATRHASPESLKMVADMINSLNKRPEPEEESQDPDDQK